MSGGEVLAGVGQHFLLQRLTFIGSIGRLFDAFSERVSSVQRKRAAAARTGVPRLAARGLDIDVAPSLGGVEQIMLVCSWLAALELTEVGLNICQKG